MPKCLGREEDPYNVGVFFQQDGTSPRTVLALTIGADTASTLWSVLLTWFQDRDLVTVRVPYEYLLAKLDEERLRGLVLRMVETDPGLAEAIDEFCPPPVSFMDGARIPHRQDEGRLKGRLTAGPVVYSIITGERFCITPLAPIHSVSARALRHLGN